MFYTNIAPHIKIISHFFFNLKMFGRRMHVGPKKMCNNLIYRDFRVPTEFVPAYVQARLICIFYEFFFVFLWLVTKIWFQSGGPYCCKSGPDYSRPRLY